MRVERALLEELSEKVFNIGYHGELNHTQVIISCPVMFRDYPDAVASMILKPPQGDLYPVSLTRDGNDLTWDVSAADVAIPGAGILQLTFTDGEGEEAEIIKTVYGAYSVNASLVANGEAPDPVQSWLDEAGAALATFENEIGDIRKITTATDADEGKALSPKTVTNGKVTEWEYIDLADPDVVTQAVDDWLDDHPEATTTVEDGAITEAKLNDSLKEDLAWQDDVDELKSALNGVQDELCIGSKAINGKASINSSGVIETVSSSEYVYCFRVIPGTIISLIGGTVSVYAYYEQEPEIGSTSYNGSRSEGAIQDECVPDDCYWVCVRTNVTPNPFTISPNSIIDKIIESESEMNDDFDSVISIIPGDILSKYRYKFLANCYVNADTGAEQELSSFFSYLDIPIDDFRGKRIYPYATTNDGHARSTVFYKVVAGAKTRISGYVGNDDNTVSGIVVPDDAELMSVCFVYDTGHTIPSVYYVGTNYSVKDTAKIQEIVEIPGNRIDGNTFTDEKRIACINFQFDDGHANDAQLYTIFKNKGLVCGFALLSTLTRSDILRYRQYQDDGFEILSHSIDGIGMNNVSVDMSVIDTKLKTSKETLEAYGFVINGFVTPSSIMADKFKPLLRKYYNYAETIYFGEYTGSNGSPYRKPYDGIYNGFRVGLQTTTLENMKLAVDKAIENYGCLTFYGHSASLDTTDYETTENINALLDYIIGKANSGLCKIGKPSDMIMGYFHVRNDDVDPGWTELSQSDMTLNENLTSASWYVRKNNKLKLCSIQVRIQTTNALNGYTELMRMPFKVTNTVLDSDNYNTVFLIHDNVLYNHTALPANTYYRLSGLFSYRD